MEPPWYCSSSVSVSLFIFLLFLLLEHGRCFELMASCTFFGCTALAQTPQLLILSSLLPHSLARNIPFPARALATGLFPAPTSSPSFSSSSSPSLAFLSYHLRLQVSFLIASFSSFPSVYSSCPSSAFLNLPIVVWSQLQTHQSSRVSSGWLYGPSGKLNVDSAKVRGTRLVAFSRDKVSQPG